MTKMLMTKQINNQLLVEQLEAAFPGVQPAMLWLQIFDGELNCVFPDALDAETVRAIIEAHDGTQLSLQELEQQKLDNAIIGFKDLPTWAAISPTEGRDYLITHVWAGQTEAQVHTWIDANVTNLAQAKTALKQLASAVITLRDMEGRLAQAILYLRDLIVK